MVLRFHTTVFIAKGSTNIKQTKQWKEVAKQNTLLHCKWSRTQQDSTIIQTSSVVVGFGRYGMPPPASNPDLWPFDLETGMRVASKVGNRPSKFGQHFRHLGSRVIRYVRDGRTDGRTDGQKQRLLPLSYGRGNNNTRSDTVVSIFSTLSHSLLRLTSWGS